MFDDASHNEIWARLQNGRQDALLIIYDKYYLSLMNYGLRLTGDRSLTNDCISQVLLHLWDRRKDLPPVENFRSYLLTCLRNELFAEGKAVILRASKTKNLQQNAPDADPGYEEYLIQLQSGKVIKDKLTLAFKNLTERERELLRLRFFEDLDYDEIAKQCGITKRTAYNIVHTAIKALKAELITSQNVSLVYDAVRIALFVLFFALNLPIS
ncbi:RNA polymerase sigma factor [Flavitalea flava]